MQLLLALSALVLHALAMPQSGDELLALLQGGDGDTPPVAGGQPACGDISSDEAFLAAIEGRCGNNTGPEPVTRCERGEFTCTPYYRCAEQDIAADRIREVDVRIGWTQFQEDIDIIQHSECPLCGDVCCREPLPEDPDMKADNDAALDAICNPDKNSLRRCEQGEFFCTPYYRCSEESIVADRISDISARIGKPQFEAESAFITHSECPLINDVCCKNPLPDTRGNVSQVYQPTCGRRNKHGIGEHIVGFKEHEAQFGEFPWMAAVLQEEHVDGGKQQVYLCGGSLIHPRIVMTSAHNIDGFQDDNLIVRLGEWDVMNDNELLSHDDIYVERAIIHENFNARRLSDDIALLVLRRPAKLRQNVDTICLPEPGDKFTQTDCVASGWGKDAFETGEYQNVLKAISLPLIPHAPCEAALKKSVLQKYFRLDKSFTCAGGKAGVDTCTGDGGSPLACLNPHTGCYVQLGIVSWGVNCGLKGVPGVYTDVVQKLDWIQQHVAEIN